MEKCLFCNKNLVGRQKKFCSLQCAGKGLRSIHIKNFLKEDGAAWNKGTSYSILKASHVWTKKGGYKIFQTQRTKIAVHRLLLGNHLGRPLRTDEIVHHITGIKSDNRIENLQIMNRSDHAKIHFPQGSRFGINAI